MRAVLCVSSARAPETPPHLARVLLWRQVVGVVGTYTQAACTADDPVPWTGSTQSTKCLKSKPRGFLEKRNSASGLPHQLLLRLPPSISAPSAPASLSPSPGTEPAGSGARRTLTLVRGTLLGPESGEEPGWRGFPSLTPSPHCLLPPTDRQEARLSHQCNDPPGKLGAA